jgi:phenylacetate-CoA ligase
VQLQPTVRRGAYRLVTGLLSDRPAIARQLRATERAPAAEVDALQAGALRRMLGEASASVPYYREVLRDSGVVGPTGDVDLDRFAAVPLLDKDAIRSRGADLRSRADRLGRLVENASGGSTGEPARFWQDRPFGDWHMTWQALIDEWAGHSPGQPKVLLWGSERDVQGARASRKVHALRWMRNENYLSFFRVTEEQMLDAVRTVNRLRPDQVVAYALNAYELAHLALDRDLPLHTPAGVSTTATTLDEGQRTVIERAFGAPVFNRYGSRETGDLAGECEAHEGLHVCPVKDLVEILRPDGSPCEPGEYGEVVVTTLHNRAMPLIRYRIGDTARWADRACSCGRTWPLLADIGGRVTDFFVAGDGALVYGGYFTRLFYGKDWVRRFQVVQEQVDRVVLRVAPRAPLAVARREFGSDLEPVVRGIREALGAECVVDVEWLDDLPQLASGKYRYTVSHVARPGAVS